MGIDIEKFKRHCNMGVDVILENDDGAKDTFKLKPLNPKQLVQFNILAEGYEAGTLSDKDTESMFDLFTDVVLNSFPELDKSLAENFALNNLINFMSIMDKLAPKVDKKKMDQLKKMKALQQSKVASNE